MFEIGHRVRVKTTYWDKAMRGVVGTVDGFHGDQVMVDFDKVVRQPWDDLLDDHEYISRGDYDATITGSGFMPDDLEYLVAPR